jgi:hypothetical protein
MEVGGNIAEVGGDTGVSSESKEEAESRRVRRLVTQASGDEASPS